MLFSLKTKIIFLFLFVCVLTSLVVISSSSAAATQKNRTAVMSKIVPVTKGMASVKVVCHRSSCTGKLKLRSRSGHHVTYGQAKFRVHAKTTTIKVKLTSSTITLVSTKQVPAIATVTDTQLKS